MIERMTAHFPAGTSVKDLDHYAQWIDDSPPFLGSFDYGKVRRIGRGARAQAVVVRRGAPSSPPVGERPPHAVRPLRRATNASMAPRRRPRTT